MASALGPLLDFPVSSLLPKKETGSTTLLSKYPNYDGRGVIIAIFDSGVDPGAPGLQVTTEGEVKVIDRIDASGAGDVDTSVVVTATDGVITGLTGRQLKIPESWVNPSGNYHIGVRSAHSLYPRQLQERLVKQKKEKVWDPIHKKLFADAQKHAQQYESKSSSNGSSHSKNNGGSGSNSGSASPDGKGSLDKSMVSSSSNGLNSFLEKLVKDDAEARVSQLNCLENKFNDLGPTYDCVVYNTGDEWRACIDTSECGELSEGVNLGEYRITHEWAPLTKDDQYNVSINVHNGGNMLEVVGMCSSHGTHVASIAAANFPDTPDKNGVAPGAKIVSIMIGDTRIGSMETGTALVRAMARVMENPYYNVDVVNMSYGEFSHWSNSGRIGDLAYEVVNKYGKIFIASAGNHGPALSTVGVPPDFKKDFIMGIGAYVSPEMMMAEYSMMEKLPGCPYTWSSRGPTVDGGRGVSVCAPGAAITSVPTYTLRNTQLMNGTSMAAPNATGCVSLLLSSLKQQNIPYSPYSVRRAVENTALKMDVDVFAQGNGLIQVDKALDYLQQHSGDVTDKIRFDVECGSDKSKGIHLRNWNADKSVDIYVSVLPIILDDNRVDPSEKISFSMDMVLTCDEVWVKMPYFLHISYMGRGFHISIDPRGLERGKAYFTTVKGYNATHPERGPMFEVPITVIVPYINLLHGYTFTSPPVQFRAGQIKRHFIAVPLGATWASVELKSSGAEKQQRFSFHAVQLKPDRCVKTLETHKVLNLSPNECSTVTLAVREGFTLEICIAQWWSCLVDGQLELSVQFHSLQSSHEEVTILCTSDGLQRVDVRSVFRSEELFPTAVLKQVVQIMLPIDSKVEVLGGERDTIPGERPIYQLILTYQFSLSRTFEVTPRCNLLNDVLYESPYESQLWMLFDNNKQILTAGDAYSKITTKLDKGDYTVKLHIRHERSDLLEKLTDLAAHLVIKLPQEIKLDIFSSYNAAITCGKKISSSINLLPGAIQPLYIAKPLLTEKTLKGLNLLPGNCLVGTLSFAKDEQVRKADQYQIRAIVVSAMKKGSSFSSDERKESKSFNDYLEAQKDMQSSWISKLDNESSEKLYQEVISTNPDFLAAHVSRLQTIDSTDSNNRPIIIALAKQITNSINISNLLAYYGTKFDTRSDAAKVKSQMDKQRNALLEALSRHGSAICGNLLSLPAEERSQDALDILDNLVIDIIKFVEPTDSKVSNFLISYYEVRGLNGLAAKLLYQQCSEKWTRDNESKLIDTYTRLGWTHAVDLFTSCHCVRFPPTYTLF